MRSIPLIAIAAWLTGGLAMAQQPSSPASPDGLACFSNLPTPEYPRSALQAHVDGSVWTYIQVSPQGTPDKIDYQVVSAWGDGQKLLTPPVEKAVRASTIKPECRGKKVWVVFRYQYHGGENAPVPKVTSRADGPNLMWIESQAAPAPVITSKAGPRH